MSLLLRIAIACVFAVSGVAKLLDRNGTRQAVAGFGVPARIVPLVAAALAPAELVTAALLVIDRTATTGLVVALAMLSGFTLAVVAALRAGRRVECHCFGRIGGADISLRTVTRNGVLALSAVAALIAAGAEEFEPLVAVAGGVALAALVVGAEGWAGQLARARKERADEAAFDLGMRGGGEDGAQAPDFELPLLAGGEADLGSLLADGRPALIVFMMAGCGPCQAMKPAVARWADAYSDRLRVVVASRGDVAANAASFAEAPRLPVLIDEDGAVANAFGIHGTPAAVLVRPDGRLRGGQAVGEWLVRRLLAAALSGAEPDLVSPQEVSGAPAESLGLDSVPVPRPTVTRHEAEGTVVLVDEETGAGATLDPIGDLVWSVLDGTSELREIVGDLADAFQTPEEVVGPDVVSMVQSLGRAGLFVGIAAEATREDVDPVSATASAGSAGS